MPSSKLPPGPGLSLSSFFAKDPLPWLDDVAARYADPMTVPIPGASPIVLTWHPESVKQLFAADPDTFAPGTAEALAAIVGRGSLFLLSGEAHKRTRRLLLPPFHGERMRSYAETIVRTSVARAKARPIGVSAPLLELAQGITLDVILEAIFGARSKDEVAILHAEILAIVDAFNPLVAMFKPLQREFGGIGPWAKLQKRARALHTSLRALIEAKRASPGDDVLSLLLSARDEDGNGLDEGALIEQLVTFVVAGHETTATSLCWAMYELHRNPAALESLRAELASVPADAPAEALAKLPCLAAVCSETLRRHAPLPIVPRRSLRDVELAGWSLPAGTHVAVGIHLAHHDPATYPDPRAFRPERFMGRTYSPFEFMPFGGGARRCIGAAFASYELQLSLASLLRSGTWRLDDDRPLATVFRIGTYGPEGGVRMTRLG